MQIRRAIAVAAAVVALTAPWPDRTVASDLRITF